MSFALSDPIHEQVSDLVLEAVRRSNALLSNILIGHLCELILRWADRPLEIDQPTIALSKIQTTGEARLLGDACLVAAGLFRERTYRIGGPEIHVRVGRTAYRTAGLCEASLNLHLMSDVLQYIPEAQRGTELDMARAGNHQAALSLREKGILIFPGNAKL